jgi:hypothetical protein
VITAPTPPSTMHTRYVVLGRPAAGSNAASRVSISPQNPASPGSPRLAIAASASTAAIRGDLAYSPRPSPTRSEVSRRSLSAPTRKNSRPVISPWAMFATSAPLTPTGVSVAMPSSTKPMWPTLEYATSRFRSVCARQAREP